MDQPDDRLLQIDAQQAATYDGAFAAQIDKVMKGIHTSLPGIIDSYDPVTQTATVQPAIKRIFSEQGATDLPVCVDVPVCFPGGGGFHLTFPVKQGDECILVFAERAIDYWYSDGGTQPPAEYRLHDLSDAFAIVGVSSLPKAIGSASTTEVELRSDDRAARVSISTSGAITIVTGLSSITMSPDGIITLSGPAGIRLNGPIQLNGPISQAAGSTGGTTASLVGPVTVANEVTAAGIPVSTHKHREQGDGNLVSPPTLT